MKGMLIGLYYTFCFGLAGLFVLADYHVFIENYYPTHESQHCVKLSNCPFYGSSIHWYSKLLMYTIAAYKKLSMCTSLLKSTIQSEGSIIIKVSTLYHSQYLKINAGVIFNADF